MGAQAIFRPSKSFPRSSRRSMAATSLSALASSLCSLQSNREGQKIAEDRLVSSLAASEQLLMEATRCPKILRRDTEPLRKVMLAAEVLLARVQSNDRSMDHLLAILGHFKADLESLNVQLMSFHAQLDNKLTRVVVSGRHGSPRSGRRGGPRRSDAEDPGAQNWFAVRMNRPARNHVATGPTDGHTPSSSVSTTPPQTSEEADDLS